MLLRPHPRDIGNRQPKLQLIDFDFKVVNTAKGVIYNVPIYFAGRNTVKIANGSIFLNID